MQIKDIFSGAVRLGGISQDALVYFNVGIPVTKINTNTVFTSQNTDYENPDFSYNFSVNAANEKYEVGYLLGAGIERYINTSVSAFINYRYQNFKTENQRQQMLTNRQMFVSNNIQVHTFLLGINKRFDSVLISKA